MKLSIIISSYNTYKLTKDCINSILNNKPKSSYEIIVVDDASPDNSGEKLKNDFRNTKQVKVVFNNKNLGYVRTNNRGLNISKGEYKLLLNSDTKVHPNSIDELLDFAKANDDVGVVGSRLLNKDGSLQASCYRFPTVKNAILEYFFGKKGLFDKYVPDGDSPTVVDAVVGASLLITPKAFKKVGGLNMKYTSYFEDLDYCRSVWSNGLKVYYLPSSIVTHIHGASFSTLTSSENQWRKLIPGSITYHGPLKHYTLFFIAWFGQKLNKLISK